MPSLKEAQLDSFCRKIGYAFKQLSLLREALTHRSHSAGHNERLEFLGDGVLNCAIAGLIFRRFPDLTEGDLSRLRANLVNQHHFRMQASLDTSVELVHVLYNQLVYVLYCRNSH